MKNSGVRLAVFLALAAILGACQLPAEQSRRDQPIAIRVITSGGFAAAYNALAPVFEEETGIRLVTESGASTGGAPDSIPSRLGRGEYFDVVILSRPALDELSAQGLISPGTQTDLVRSRIGMAVRAGAPVPDISTPEKFAEVLRNASSIGYSASVSGTYLATELWPAMGIWPEIEGKSRRIVSERVGAVVARGEVEIGFQQISEILPIPGVVLAGPLPESLQLTTVFAAAVTRQSVNGEAARRLIAYLASPAAAPLIEAQGLEPVASQAVDGNGIDQFPGRIVAVTELVCSDGTKGFCE